MVGQVKLNSAASDVNVSDYPKKSMFNVIVFLAVTILARKKGFNSSYIYRELSINTGWFQLIVSF